MLDLSTRLHNLSQCLQCGRNGVALVRARMTTCKRTGNAAGRRSEAPGKSIEGQPPGAAPRPRDNLLSQRTCNRRAGC